MKGIEFKAKNVSIEAKAKLDTLIAKKNERLNKIVESYRNGTWLIRSTEDVMQSRCSAYKFKIG